VRVTNSNENPYIEYIHTQNIPSPAFCLNMHKAKVYKTFEMSVHLLPESTQGFGAMLHRCNPLWNSQTSCFP